MGNSLNLNLFDSGSGSIRLVHLIFDKKYDNNFLNRRTCVTQERIIQAFMLSVNERNTCVRIKEYTLGMEIEHVFIIRGVNRKNIYKEP